MSAKKRDLSVDITRSLAIVLMVSANMAVILHEEPVWIFRLVSSLAAPMFIIVANMMLVLGHLHGKNFKSVLEKVIFLFVVAVLFDISNVVMPLVNVDILYFIGLSMIFSSLVVRFSIPFLSLLGVGILALAVLWQSKYGCQMGMLYYHLSMENIYQCSVHFLEEVPHRYLIDGWFPLFPWASMGLFGVILGKLRYHKGGIITSFAQRRHVCAALILLITGALLWKIFPGHQAIIHNYIELFYPAAPGFMIVAMGAVYSTLILMDYVGDVSIWSFIHPLGEASLFMYFFHITVISHVLLPLGQIDFGVRFMMYYLILLGLMIAIGYWLRSVRKNATYKKMPHVIKWIFG